ncbi:NmrA family NAD(P)-binding protein [Microdochium nivale]|nr:NmrA family NAD(P)-binding protein [Microdochium nivale]
MYNPPAKYYTPKSDHNTLIYKHAAMKAYRVLVVGATGAQGSATIAALAAAHASSHAHLDLTILALTRSAASPGAQVLAAKYPGLVELVQGDLASPAVVLDAAHDGGRNIDAVFLVTVPPNDEAHGVAFVDAAVARRVPHIVFSSVDRGGDDASWQEPTSVAHFAAKHRVEMHLRARTAKRTTTTAATTTTTTGDEEAGTTHWTILRPSGFMDNYRPSGAMSSMMAGLWATMSAATKMQLVSVRDIGRVAAAALLDPASWAGRAVGLAGDDLTFAQASDAYQRVHGHAMPKTWDVVSRGVRWVVADARQSMDWFEREGFGVDMQVLRKEGFHLQDFETWLRSEKDSAGAN